MYFSFGDDPGEINLCLGTVFVCSCVQNANKTLLPKSHATEVFTFLLLTTKDLYLTEEKMPGCTHSVDDAQ